MKYFSTLLCLLPVWGWAQQDTTRPTVFKLTVEVRDLDTEIPIENAWVKITSTEGDRAEFLTGNTGTVIIDKFLQPGKSYVLEIGCKGYFISSTQATVTGQVSTNKMPQKNFTGRSNCARSLLNPFRQDYMNTNSWKFRLVQL